MTPAWPPSEQFVMFTRRMIFAATSKPRRTFDVNADIT